MRAGCVNNTNFQGRLIIVNGLSNKPANCINKVKSDIEKLVEPKDYNLYISQDYSKQEINIKADYAFPYKSSQKIILLNTVQENIPINSKASRYVDAAKKTIQNHETSIQKQKEMQWEKEQNKAEKKELFGTALFLIAFPVLYLADSVKEEYKNFKITFNKIAKKFATKKG